MIIICKLQNRLLGARTLNAFAHIFLFRDFLDELIHYIIRSGALLVIVCNLFLSRPHATVFIVLLSQLIFNFLIIYLLAFFLRDFRVELSNWFLLFTAAVSSLFVFILTLTFSYWFDVWALDG